ncbi:MAG: hypothetical protein KDA89_02855 [Planctomycetaceae bacterium]|nr:hypothetical protein [Planctomycetaceae bacterium]
MHVFCWELVEGVSELAQDGDSLGNETFYKTVVDLLRLEHPSDDVPSPDGKELMTMVLELVLNHPSLAGRFRKYVAPCEPRLGVPSPQDVPGQQDLFDALRLVENQFIQCRQPTEDDVAVAYIDGDPVPDITPPTDGGDA